MASDRQPEGPVAVKQILEILERTYPDARCALDFSSPFQLLIAVMLSAQTTDRMVNLITPALFSRYPEPADFAVLATEDLAEAIKRVGLFRSKARNIINTCRLLVEEHGGEVPRERGALERLPGVGRKTASVVLSNAFGIPAIAVDTHVFRVANRLGLANACTPEATEQQLMKAIPREKWSQAHHWLICHGRQTCHARKPSCDACELAPYCRHAQSSGRV